MIRKRDFRGLLKIASMFPPQTVGDFMHSWNSDLNANINQRRNVFDKINRAGLDVKQPASRIPYIVGGGIIGRAAASYLGGGSTMKGIATIGGALYGNHLYNKNHPDPTIRHVAPGVIHRGF